MPKLSLFLFLLLLLFYDAPLRPSCPWFFFFIPCLIFYPQHPSLLAFPSTPSLRALHHLLRPGGKKKEWWGGFFFGSSRSPRNLLDNLAHKRRTLRQPALGA
jgi:hypothetical protein